MNDILENDVTSEIGLYLENSVLSPFLYKGFTSENFNVSGNIPVDKILLIMYVKGDET
jgi:hypothetical protein